MNKDFESFYVDIHSKDPSKPLYHDWLFNQVFSGEDIDLGLAGKIKLAIHESLLNGFATGSIIKLAYCNEMESRVIIKHGKLKGTKISEVLHNEESKKILQKLRDSTKDQVVRQACRSKLSEMFEARKMVKQFNDKKLHNIKRINVPRTK